jgi:hypothetical protein
VKTQSEERRKSKPALFYEANKKPPLLPKLKGRLFGFYYSRFGPIPNHFLLLVKIKNSIGVLAVIFACHLPFILLTYALRARAGRVFATRAV